MLMTKRAHLAHTSLLERQIEWLKESHEREISALLAQIADLRSFVFSPTRANDIPAALAEADAVLTQNEPHVPEAQTDEEKEIDNELRERDRLFSGNFDEIIL